MNSLQRYKLFLNIVLKKEKMRFILISFAKYNITVLPHEFENAREG